MQRQKTAEEFEQERRDEEFARQLQEQLDSEEPARQNNPRPTQQAQSGYPGAGAAGASPGGRRGQLLVCPGCQTVNDVDLRPGQRAQCGTCSLIFVPNPNNRMSPSRTSPPAHPQTSLRHSSRITCQNCRSINEIPVNSSTTKFMCGFCYRILTFNQSPGAEMELPPANVRNNNTAAGGAQHSAPQNQNNNNNVSQPAAGAAPSAEGEVDSRVYQGSVVKRLQVRCGECDTVNQVRANPKDSLVKFTCSSCQQENEVEIAA